MRGRGVGKCLQSDHEIHHQIYTLMQTILGASGVIGHELSRALPKYTDRIRRERRAPHRVNPTDETFVADLLDAKATEKAVHTFAYTPDTGRATAGLGQSDEAYGQTWHLATSREPITGEGLVRLACERAGRPFKLQVAPRWMVRLIGLFNSVLRENDELIYQFEHDYRFGSSKVEAACGIEPTSYRDGIAETVAQAR
jgi:hypothetical protein